jgi:hypothetical protein
MFDRFDNLCSLYTTQRNAFFTFIFFNIQIRNIYFSAWPQIYIQIHNI